MYPRKPQEQKQGQPDVSDTSVNCGAHAYFRNLSNGSRTCIATRSQRTSLRVPPCSDQDRDQNSPFWSLALDLWRSALVLFSVVAECYMYMSVIPSFALAEETKGKYRIKGMFSVTQTGTVLVKLCQEEIPSLKIWPSVSNGSLLDLCPVPHSGRSHCGAPGDWLFLTLHVPCFLLTASTLSFSVIFLAAFLLSSGSPHEDRPQELVLMGSLERLICLQLCTKATFRSQIRALPA